MNRSSKRLVPLACCLLLPFFPLPSVAEEPSGFHVAPDGSDSNPGTREQPFATLERARDALRELRSRGPLSPGGVTVRLRGGLYFRERAFVLEEADSGAEGATVTYASAEGERARLVGGRAVTGWGPVTDPDARARLGEGARRILQADLRALGVRDLGMLRSRGFGREAAPSHLELFVRGKRMTLARWPNQGHVRITGLGDVDPAGDGHGGQLGRLDGGFQYEGDRPARWKTSEDIWVHGYWAWDWANTYEAVESIDTARRLVRTRPPHGQYGFRVGQRIYFLNVLEELDAPGEYYVDTRKGLLFFWPPDGIEPGSLTGASPDGVPDPVGPVLVSVLEEPLVELRSASHVVFRGLTLEASRGSGIRIRGGTANLVSRCSLLCLGNCAITIDGGTGHGVAGCEIQELADGGVSLSGGDRASLSPAGHYAEDNLVHHLAQWSRCYHPAFLVSGVGCRLSHNLVHDHPHCAVLFGGNEHVIELNEIHHVCLDTGDVGAIYMGRDWTARGNTIRNNYIHHTGGVGMGSMGVYLDDCASGATVFGNVFHKVQRAAFIGGGRDNRVVNNVFVDCNPAVSIDGRGLDPSPVWRNMIYETMKARLHEVKHRELPYAERYPELKALDAYYEKADGVPPEGNVIARNVCVGGAWLQVHWHARPEMLDVRDNWLSVDPRFVDAERGNFQLRPDSPVLAAGFERIPFEEIGPRPR